MPNKQEPLMTFQLEGDGANGEPRALEMLVYDYIGDDGWGGGISAKDCCERLSACKDCPAINVRINSAGGEVFDAVAIYNALARHPAQVTVDVDGMALSAASVIAMAGDRIRMAQNAMMMIHNPLDVVYGDAGELREKANVLDKIKETIVGTYQARTGLPGAEISALMDRETWMTADEAIARKFCDEATPAKRIAAQAVDLGRFKKTPQNFAASIEMAASKKKEGTMPTMQERIAALEAADKEAVTNIRAEANHVGCDEGKRLARAELDKPATAQQYMDAFGETTGAVLFAKAVPFAEAQKQHTAKLHEQIKAQAVVNDAQTAEIVKLKARVVELRGGAAPVDLSNSLARSGKGQEGGEEKPKSLAQMVRIARPA